MKRLFQKISGAYIRQKTLSYLLLVLLAFFWHSHSVAPFFANVKEKIGSYVYTLQPSMPTLIIADKRLTLVGDLPTQITMPDGVEFWFMHTADSNVIKNSKRFSCIISDSILYLKGKSRIYPLNYKDISVDSTTSITADWLLQQYHSLTWKWYYPIQAASLFAIFLALLLLSYFYAGIALFADAFNNGPFSFTIFFRIAVLVLILDSVILWIGSLLSFSTMHLIWPVIVITTFAIFLTTLWFIKKKNREAEL